MYDAPRADRGPFREAPERTSPSTAGWIALAIWAGFAVLALLAAVGVVAAFSRLTKDLPVPEMEQLMTANAQVTDEDLRELANQRAQAVKDSLVETSKIPADRVFLLAPKVSAVGIKDKGKPTRVDFSLK